MSCFHSPRQSRQTNHRTLESLYYDPPRRSGLRLLQELDQNLEQVFVWRQILGVDGLHDVWLQLKLEPQLVRLVLCWQQFLQYIHGIVWS